MSITLTKSAVKEVNKIIADQGLLQDEMFLRIGVIVGGCAGYNFTLDLTDDKNDDDEEFETEGVKVIVDPASIVYLNGTTIDFKDEPTGSGFVFDNPNTTKKCGSGKCGCSSEDSNMIIDTQHSAYVDQLRLALVFAASVIKDGGCWTKECDQIIGDALGNAAVESPFCSENSMNLIQDED